MTAPEQAPPRHRRAPERRGRPTGGGASGGGALGGSGWLGVDVRGAERRGLGQQLREARERKGVDLFRAERDTKIRHHYLSALERDDFRQLPDPVYTKGFLRNYAEYLDLEPGVVIAQWKREAAPRRVEGPVLAALRPLKTPGRGFTITRGLVVGLVLTLGVVAFVAYLVLQLLRFAQPPPLALATLRDVVVEAGATSTVLNGTAAAGDTVTIDAPGDRVYVLQADASGRWSQRVELGRGENAFRVRSTDQATGKESDPLEVVVQVVAPLPSRSPSTSLVELVVPADGVTVTNGAVVVRGSTSAPRVTVRADPVSEPNATTRSSTPAPRAVAVRPDGTFSESLWLPAGTWTLSVGAANGERTDVADRRITVVYSGLQLAVSARRLPVAIAVWVDGRPAPGFDRSQRLTPGRELVFRGRETIEVRASRPGALTLIQNGVALAPIATGTAGPSTWMFRPGADPAPSTRR